MRILIESIPHAQQRYPTVGDWYCDPRGAVACANFEPRDPRGYCKHCGYHECEHAGHEGALKPGGYYHVERVNARFYGDMNLTVRVSTMRVWEWEALAAVHELVEALLCHRNRITQQEVDAWDLAHPDSDNPGSLPGCPYGRQHEVATAIERLLAECMGTSWANYEEAVRTLAHEGHAMIRTTVDYPEDTQ
jgi:hypothetical protein